MTNNRLGRLEDILSQPPRDRAARRRRELASPSAPAAPNEPRGDRPALPKLERPAGRRPERAEPESTSERGPERAPEPPQQRVPAPQREDPPPPPAPPAAPRTPRGRQERTSAEAPPAPARRRTRRDRRRTTASRRSAANTGRARIPVRLDPDLHAAVSAAARAQGVSLAAIAFEAIEAAHEAGELAAIVATGAEPETPRGTLFSRPMPRSASAKSMAEFRMTDQDRAVLDQLVSEHRTTRTHLIEVALRRHLM